jgi:hypothetical protein
MVSLLDTAQTATAPLELVNGAPVGPALRVGRTEEGNPRQGSAPHLPCQSVMMVTSRRETWIHCWRRRPEGGTDSVRGGTCDAEPWSRRGQSALRRWPCCAGSSWHAKTVCRMWRLLTGWGCHGRRWVSGLPCSSTSSAMWSACIWDPLAGDPIHGMRPFRRSSSASLRTTAGGCLAQ